MLRAAPGVQGVPSLARALPLCKAEQAVAHIRERSQILSVTQGLSVHTHPCSQGFRIAGGQGIGIIAACQLVLMGGSGSLFHLAACDVACCSNTISVLNLRLTATGCFCQVPSELTSVIVCVLQKSTQPD
jgi:hypothetical protein